MDKNKLIDTNNPAHIILLFSAVICVIIALFMPAFIVLILGLAAAVLRIYKIDTFDKKSRMKALKTAENFLEPYNEKNILGNLKLTNKFCTIYLHRNEHMIGIKERVLPYRESISPRCDRKKIFDAWNAICSTFHHNKRYEDLVQECLLYGLVVAPKEHVTPIDTTPKPKVDINNCSIIEITDLPGINIVLSKRIIKKREEIGGFKTTKEFFDFINLKPHFVEQLKQQIFITKMRGTLKIQRSSERSIDF